MRKPKSITSRQLNLNYFTMKLKTFFAVVFAVLAVNAVAQDLKFGAKGGLNFSNFGGDEADHKMKVGFHIGGFAQYGINDALSLQPELLLSFEGAKDDGGDDNPTSLTYINIPVMVNYKIAAVQGLYVEVGPQLGFLLGAKYDGEDEIMGDKVKDYFKSTNFSLGLGAGYAINDNISVGLRYSLGLTSIADDSDADIKQNNFQLGLAYKF